MSWGVDRWRLIVDPASPGVDNMAVDRAIQIARDTGSSPPTLRLYRWARPTATIGRFQAVDSVDLAACEEFGVDVVRRFTGGRGVLHDDELTYSVIASVSEGVPRGTASSYRYVSSALSETYRRLGVDAQLVSRDVGVKGSAACYLHATPADLSLRGRKLSGSAQVWLHETVLQHGSFVRTRDVPREAAVFRLDVAAARRLAETTVTLADELDRLASIEDIVEAAVAGFAAALGVEFEVGDLTSEERALAAELMAEVEVL